MTTAIAAVPLRHLLADQRLNQLSHALATPLYHRTTSVPALSSLIEGPYGACLHQCGPWSDRFSGIWPVSSCLQLPHCVHFELHSSLDGQHVVWCSDSGEVQAASAHDNHHDSRHRSNPGPHCSDSAVKSGRNERLRMSVEPFWSGKLALAN
jgi:hypothetical protein